MSDIEYFVHGSGMRTLESLFKRHIAKTIVRRVLRDGTVEFYLYSEYNPRWKNGAGWRLTNRATIIKAIELSKKHHLQMIRE